MDDDAKSSFFFFVDARRKLNRLRMLRIKSMITMISVCLLIICMHFQEAFSQKIDTAWLVSTLSSSILSLERKLSSLPFSPQQQSAEFISLSSPSDPDSSSSVSSDTASSSVSSDTAAISSSSAPESPSSSSPELSSSSSSERDISSISSISKPDTSLSHSEVSSISPPPNLGNLSSIVQLTDKDPDFSEINKLIKGAGATFYIDQSRDLTMFLPTNESFKKFNNDHNNDNSTNLNINNLPWEIKWRIVQYHILPQVDLNLQYIKYNNNNDNNTNNNDNSKNEFLTWEGSILTLSRINANGEENDENSYVCINDDKNVIINDKRIETKNGGVFKINSLLIPPDVNLSEYINTKTEHNNVHESQDGSKANEKDEKMDKTNNLEKNKNNKDDQPEFLDKLNQQHDKWNQETYLNKNNTEEMKSENKEKTNDNGSLDNGLALLYNDINHKDDFLKKEGAVGIISEKTKNDVNHENDTSGESNVIDRENKKKKKKNNNDKEEMTNNDNNDSITNTNRDDTGFLSRRRFSEISTSSDQKEKDIIDTTTSSENTSDQTDQTDQTDKIENPNKKEISNDINKKKETQPLSENDIKYITEGLLPQEELITEYYSNENKPKITITDNKQDQKLIKDDQEKKKKKDIPFFIAKYKIVLSPIRFLRLHLLNGPIPAGKKN